MSERESELSKYHIKIDRSMGTVIGDEARVEQHFHITTPTPSVPILREDLLSAVRSAGAELRTYRNEIAGIHLDRKEVSQIVEWVLSADPGKRLGMVLDQPGGGKTVVMRDVLEKLEAENIPVLAIKADTLSGIKSYDNLAERLGLPLRVDECARLIANGGVFVVLLDQLDALSLALSRDQATLDVMLGTLARLRELSGVRIVGSCRIFDLNNDPRLSQIPVDRKFRLQPLENEQINQILQTIHIDPDRLLPGHRTLLTVPLHLDVYAQVITADILKSQYESFRSLQDLYEALWQKRMNIIPPDKPSPSERVGAIYRLVESMQNNRQITAPLADLDEFPEAADYLERIGFIRREKSNWLFFHQTLFDYSYARRFAAQGKSLSQEILKGPQGLFDRSQMVQVLAYLRGSNQPAYLRELTGLLFAVNLRVHLRLLLIGWFGSLPDPTSEELRIARRLMSVTDDCVRFFNAVGGNEGWFDLLKKTIIPELLNSDNEQLVDIVTNYLGTMIHSRSDAVLAHLKPFLSQSEAWDGRIAFALAHIKKWESEEALDILCDLIKRGRTLGRESSYFYSLAESNPVAGCRALRAFLDRRLDELLHGVLTEEANRFSRDQNLLGEYTVGELIEAAAQLAPDKFLENLLPWFVRAAVSLAEHTRNDSYPSDPLFSWGWYGEHISEGPAFARQMAEALQHISRNSTSDFRELAKALLPIESQAVQRVLAQAYLADPETYADDIFKYLIGDPRRISIGEVLESPQYDSVCLFSAAFQYMDGDHRVKLEQLILDLQPEWERQSHKHRGLTQLRFLISVPLETLTENTRRKRLELERKFPGFTLQPPQGVTGGAVGPPIEQASQIRMSDEAWLGAMRKYDDTTEWGAPRNEFLEGGVIELSRSFTERVKEEPERFYLLAKCFDERISLHYVTAAISGLAESGAPAGWLFDLVRQYAPHIKESFRREVCWALEKRATDGVPDDILDILTDWALHDPDPSEERWESTNEQESFTPNNDPHHQGINSNRGAAIKTLCWCALKRKPVQPERAFYLLEKSANDPSTAVRTCVIESLGYLLNEDDEHTLNIFEKTLESHPILLKTPLVHHYLYWVYFHHFPRIRPFIEKLLVDVDTATRQAGARIACLAAFQYHEAETLAKRVMNGDEAMRRGAAQVYARNLDKPELESICQEQLLLLMNDTDDQVRGYVGDCFIHLQSEQLDRLRTFIEEFIISPALLDGAEHLIKYLQSLAVDEHQLALKITERILDIGGKEIVDIRTSRAIFEQDLVSLPLAVYTHSQDEKMKSKAIDLFERMLELGSRSAHQALADWDRR